MFMENFLTACESISRRTHNIGEYKYETIDSSLFLSFRLHRFALTSPLGLFDGDRRIWWIAGMAPHIAECSLSMMCQSKWLSVKPG
jgi:hypothetical protein